MSVQQQPIPIDPKQSVILSSGELNFYHRLAAEDSERKESGEKRAEQRLRSQARYKVWGNTIDALRSKKKSDKVKQAEENEAYQQIIDTEESQYQEAQRRVVLDRANRILWQETDKVKHLHSGLLLSSVMKEREQQLELKKFKKAQLGEIDKTFEIIAEENRQKGLAREREEEEARLAKNHIGQKMQLEQLQLCRAKQAHERAETIAEGERMKAAAAERVKEAEKAEIERHDKMRAYNLEYLRANQESLSIRQVRADEEAKEDEKIAKFAYEKERMFALRKEHEAAKTKAKQTRFENMLQRQFNHLKNIKDSENSRIERQVIEMKEKEDNKFAEKAERARRLAEATRISRNGQLRRKADEAERQRQIDAVLAEQWKLRNREMEEAEGEAERKTVENNLRLQATLKEQMMVREERIRNELSRERDECRMMQEARQREDAVFHAYAQQQLKELTIRGKTAVPVLAILEGDKLKASRAGNFQVMNFR